MNTTGKYPLVYNNPPTIKVAICYNPFVINDITKTLLEYDSSKNLADYMQGLPDEVKWVVAYNGEPIDEDQWVDIKPQPDSIITIVRVPEGGHGGGKTILRVVALIAVAAFAQWAAPGLASLIAGGGYFGLSASAAAIAATTAAVTMAGGFIVNALLPAQQLNPNSGPTSQSYSISGPKNTAREGVPVPIIYGQFRYGGNITDVYTRNIGDDQYLFMRTALNDGEVSDISDIQLNNQPIYTFGDVEYISNLGTAGEQPVSWFQEAIRLFNLQQDITPTGVSYVTTSDCDRVRVDVSFPLGLISISPKSGNRYDQTVQLAIQYRQMSEDGTTAIGSWQDLPLDLELPLDTSGGSGIYTVSASKSANFTILPDTPTTGDSWSVTAEYKKATDTNWITVGTKTGNVTNNSQYSGLFITSKNTEAFNWWLSFPTTDDWEVRFIGGSVQDNTTSNPNLNKYTKENVPGTINNLTRTAQTQNPFVLTYQSSTLTRGRYELLITRANTESTDPNKPDTCYVTDIGEIDNSNVSYSGIAMQALKIKLTSQLSSQPTMTSLVTGSLVNIYDDDGNITATQWSDNPADIVLDMMITRSNGLYKPTQFIFSKFSEWRDFCTANNLKFNGVFDFVTTLWDAVQSVARVGHAVVVPQGTSFTVAIDQAADPVMIFTGSNMYQDTFTKTWVNLADRANEIQQVYYDQNDYFRQKTLRLPDAAAQSRGDPVKPANVSGFGITSIEQASAEAEYQARQNSYTTNTVSFDAPIEAIALQLGDVALVQHDSIKYADGVGGRIDSGCTTSVINLDRPVTMNTGDSYSILINTDSYLRYSPTVTSVTGNKITVTGLPDTLERIRRAIQGVTDREVYKIVSLGSGSYVLTLDDASMITTGSIGLWDTDVIQEAPVVFQAGETSIVTLVTPLSAPPSQFSNFLFGQVTTVKQPYRLTNISATDDLYRRTLTFSNYDSNIYEPGSWGTPDIVAPTILTVSQVQNLGATWDTNPLPNQQRIAVQLSWQRQNDASAYGGADIYTLDSTGLWKSAGSVQNATLWQTNQNRGDNLTYKVVCFDQSGNRASFSEAPTVAVTLSTQDITLADPTSLSVAITAFDISATVKASWGASTAVSIDGYEVCVGEISNTDYDAFVAAAGNQANFPTSVLSDATYTYLGITTDLFYNISKLDVTKYSVRIRAKYGFAYSDWIYSPLDVEAPLLPVNVSNLILSNAVSGSTSEFSARDASFQWDDILSQQASSLITTANGMTTYLLDYKIQIKDTNGNILRTEYTNSPSYTYSYDKNHADNTNTAISANRTFSISVQLRGKQGQLSAADSLLVSNSPPSLTSATIVNGSSQTTLNYQTGKESDFVGIIVWADTTNDFTASNANIVYQGSGAATWATVDKTTYFYKYAFYDLFGTDSLNISAQGTFVAGVSVDATTVGGSSLSTINSAINTAQSTANTAVANANTALTAAQQEVTDRQAAVAALTATSDAQINALQAQVSDLAGTQDYDGTKAYQTGDFVKWTDGALYTAIQNVPAGTDPSNAAYWERIGAYSSVGDALTGLSVDVATHTTDITNLNGALTSEVSNRETLAAQLRGGYTGTDPTAVSTGLVYNLRQAQVSGDAVNASSIAAVSASLSGKADASALDSTNVNVSSNAGNISAAVSRISALEADIPGLATASALDSTNANVSTNTSGIAAAVDRISSLEADIPGLATASALNTTNANVTAQGDTLTSTVSSLNDLKASTANPNANLVYNSTGARGTDQWGITSGGGAAFGPDIGYSFYLTASGGSIGSPRFSIEYGNPFTLSFMSGGANYTGQAYNINYYDVGDNYLSQDTGYVTAAGLGYQRTTVTVNKPAGAIYCRLYFGFGTFTSGGFLEIFKIKFEIGSVATTWTDDATVGQSLQATAAALDTTNANVSSNTSGIAAAVTRIGALEADIPGLASAAALDSTNATVSSINGTLTSTVNSLNSLSAHTLNPNTNLVKEATFSLGGKDWTNDIGSFYFGIGSGDVGYYASCNTDNRVISSDKIYLSPGSPYTLSAHFGGYGGGTYNSPPVIILRGFAADDTFVTDLITVYAHPVADGYYHLSASGTAPSSGVVYWRVLCSTYGSGLNGNTAVFSQIKLELGSTATTFTDDATYGPIALSNASAINSTNVNVSTNADNITAAVARIGALEADIPGLATAAALDSTNATVASQGGNISSLSSSVTSLSNKIVANFNLIRNSTFALGFNYWMTGDPSYFNIYTGVGDIGYYLMSAASGRGLYSDPVAVFGNTTYTFTAIIGSQGGNSYPGTPPYVCIVSYDAGGNYIGTTHYIFADNPGNGYLRKTVTAQTPANTAHVRAFCVTSDNQNGNSACYSQLKLEVGPISTIWTDDSGYADAVNAASSAISALNSSVSYQGGQITANASDLSSLSATVGSHTASITSLSSVQATHGTAIASMVNLSIVGGKIAGTVSLNDGTTSSFDVLADNFSISSSGTGARTEFSSGNWRVYDSSGTLRVRMGVW